MAGQGPSPKDPSQRVRRNTTSSLVRLPAEGRKGKEPPWPLLPDIALRARRDLFATKVEALQDERREIIDSGGRTAVVDRKIDAAMERSSVIEAQLAAQAELELRLWTELWKLPQAVEWERLAWLRDVAQYVRFKVMGELGDLDSAKEARMWSDRLGLTPLAMLRLRWEVVRDEVAAKREEHATSARGRIKAVS